MIEMKRTYQELEGKVPMSVDTILDQGGMDRILRSIGTSLDEKYRVSVVMINSCDLHRAYDVLHHVCPVIHYKDDDSIIYLYLPEKFLEEFENIMRLKDIAYEFTNKLCVYIDESEAKLVKDELLKLTPTLISNGYDSFEIIETELSLFDYRYAIKSENLEKYLTDDRSSKYGQLKYDEYDFTTDKNVAWKWFTLKEAISKLKYLKDIVGRNGIDQKLVIYDLQTDSRIDLPIKSSDKDAEHDGSSI